jgi:beta-lactam-binding protein with PASTA domain
MRGCLVLSIAVLLLGCTETHTGAVGLSDHANTAPPFLRVPDVYNRSPATAKAILTRAGFRVAVTRQTRQWLTRPTAVVMMQAPRAGEWLKRGGVVGLFLSRVTRHP